MGAVMKDNNLLLQAGIDPRTGMPVKASTDSPLKDNMKAILSKIDEQDAINRFTWYNLPKGLNGQLIEKILYYRGQGAFFYMETNDTFYFLPYALDGTIDVYGRFNTITPLPFAGGATTSDDGKERPWIVGMTRDVAHEEIMPWDLSYDDLTTKCVLLHDLSTGLSQTNIPRSVMSEPLIDTMADCLPFLHTALMASTGVAGMKVNNQDEYSNVEAASRAINHAALNGKKWVPIIGTIDFQDLTGGNVAKSEEFLLSMQAMDNLRLSTLGLDNGGLFQKKSHMLQAEQEMNAGNVGLIAQDSLTLRQHFCNIVNSIWGLGMWCESSEVILGIDRNQDGQIADEMETKEAESLAETEDMEVATDE